MMKQRFNDIDHLEGAILGDLLDNSRENGILLSSIIEDWDDDINKLDAAAE